MLVFVSREDGKAAKFTKIGLNYNLEEREGHKGYTKVTIRCLLSSWPLCPSYSFHSINYSTGRNYEAFSIQLKLIL
jgi:hypothetical protein